MNVLTVEAVAGKKITIKEIETLTETEAQAAAVEVAEIKDHTIYFVDLGGNFGYSVLVFKDGHHIKYANDYALHYRDKTPEELNEQYKRSLAVKLYTDEELAEPLKSYDEYTAKQYYLQNYYGLRRDHVSIFCINPSKEQQAEFERKTKTMIYDPVAFAYYDDLEFVQRHVELFAQLEERYNETATDYEYQKAAFMYELGNHEYHINNYQGDWDTLSAFGNIQWHGQGIDARVKYYKELKFNDVQIQAFEDARKEYLKQANINEWY